MKLIVEESSLRDFNASWNKKEGTFLLSWNPQFDPVCSFAAEWLESKTELKLNRHDNNLQENRR